MSDMKPHLYINSRGFFTTRHSYSGSDSFHFCARKYYLERVQGWSEKEQRSSTAFGIALEKAVTFWHQRGQNTAEAVAEFVRAWAEAKDKPYTYSKSDKDWDSLNLTGQEMVKLYAILYPSRPYVVKNPRDAFQVETTFEVFPGTKLAGLEFTSYIDLVAELKATHDPQIIDMKTSGKEVPALTVLDPQLRSYSWVKGWKDVAFEWFRKMGRSISRGDEVYFLEACGEYMPGASAMVLAKDDFGLWVTSEQKVFDEMAEKFIGESKAVKEGRQKFVEANAIFVQENKITKQRVQYKAAVISKESAEDKGSAIKKDIVDIVNANEKEMWSMDGGVRWPNDKCNMCCMRGICANQPELRDMLLVRKQLDEFEFSVESE